VERKPRAVIQGYEQMLAVASRPLHR
jgi:hypothetical protein